MRAGRTNIGPPTDSNDGRSGGAALRSEQRGAFGINVQVQHFRDVRLFQQNLLSRNQRCNLFDFRVVQMEEVLVDGPVDLRVCEKELRRTAFNGDSSDLGSFE